MGYSDKFEKAYKLLKSYEGGFVNHKNDPGGETKFGITKNVARKYGYDGDMNDLKEEKAKEIYYKGYWRDTKIEKIEHEKTAIELLEEVVNLGKKIPILNLQKIYNVIEDGDITVDGVIGEETLSAINNCKHPDDIYLWLNILQGCRYWNLVEENGDLKDFIRGWGKRIEINKK